MARKPKTLGQKAKVFWNVSRPLNCLMGGAGVIIAMLVGLGTLPGLELAIPGFIAVFLIMAGGNSLNDYYDVEIDKVNRPDRPIPSGQVSKREIWSYATILFGLGIFSSLFLTFIPVVIAVVNSVLLGAYAWRLKATGFFGNILISYLVASVFAFGGAAAGHLAIGSILAIVVFFTSAAREVFKDMEDIRGDKKYGARTLPAIAGEKKAILVAGSFLMIAILVSPLPYLLELLSIYYLVIVAVVDIVFIFTILSMWRKPTINNAKNNQQMLKIASVLGLIAFLAGAL